MLADKGVIATDNSFNCGSSLVELTTGLSLPPQPTIDKSEPVNKTTVNRFL